MEKVQQRATRTLAELKGLSYEGRLRSLQLPMLAYRRIRGDMIETYKILNGFFHPNVVPKLQDKAVTCVVIVKLWEKSDST